MSYDFRKLGATASYVWKYVDGHGNVFFMGEKTTGTLKSPFSGQPFKSRPIRVSISSLGKELGANAEVADESPEPPKANKSNEDMILEAAQKLSTRAGDRVHIAEIKRLLPSLPLHTLHSTLLTLQQQGKLILYKLDDPKARTPADDAAALEVAGSPRHIVYLTP